METSIHKHRRILLHFFLGIGLPSLLLGYLAFRGIQNDIALLEKEWLDEHRATAQQITRIVDEKMVEIEQVFLDTLANHQVFQGPDLLPLLERLKNRYPLVEDIFFFNGAEQIRFPLVNLLFLPDGSAPSSPQTQLPALSVGQQYEFQQKRYREALISYRQTLALVSDREVKGEVLSAIARVQKKSNLLPDAIKSYQTIAQDYSEVQTSSGMPLGLIARLELGALFLAIDDSSRAVETFVNLYQGLLYRQWVLERSQYEFYTKQIEASIDEVLSQEATFLRSYRSTFGTLKAEGRRERALTERLLVFQENAASKLPIAAPRKRGNLGDVRRRFTLGIGEHTYLVSTLDGRKGSKNQANGILGLLLNAEHLKVDLLQPIVLQHVSGKIIHWQITGRDGEILLKSGRPSSGSMTIKTDFIGTFPPWSIEFYQQDPHLLETLLTSRRSIYLYMFILLAGILIFGLTLTIRTVTRELELGKMKSDFVSTISHEFKSPLTSIRQLAEMLQTGRVFSEERRQRYYDVLLEQSERLSLLIDDILDFSRMEEGGKQFEFERTDIGMLLKELVSTIQQRVRHEGFTIQLKLDSSLPPIEVDRAAMVQAITNLIDNAIKYSDQAREVDVRAFAENRYLIVSVQDFGTGIQPEEIDKLFERFYRGGDELTRTVKGSGLGLTLVKQIVDAHRGAVHVDSEPGRGSTFSIRLPLQLKEDG